MTHRWSDVDCWRHGIFGLDRRLRAEDRPAPQEAGGQGAAERGLEASRRPEDAPWDGAAREAS